MRSTTARAISAATSVTTEAATRRGRSPLAHSVRPVLRTGSPSRPEHDRRRTRHQRRKHQDPQIDRRILQAQKPAGASATIPPIIHCSERDANGAAMADSRRLSTTSCRTRRPAPAPSADRIANSRLALMPRATAGSHTFAQPITGRDDRPEHQNQRQPSRPPIRCSRSETTTTSIVALVRWVFPGPRAAGDRVHLCSVPHPARPRASTGRQRSTTRCPDPLLVILNQLRCPDDELAWPRQQLRLEVRGQDADHGHQAAIQADRAVHDPGIAAEASLPQESVMIATG